MANKDLSRWFPRRKLPIKGDQGPVGGSGPMGPQGPVGGAGIQGAQGPAGLPNITSINTAPGRSLNSTFQIHASRPAVVVYSVQMRVQLSALGTSTAMCELRSDSGTPPTTQRDVARLSHQMTVGITVGDVIEVTDSLSTVVNAGENVRMVTTTANGGAVTLVGQTEIVL